MSTTRTKNASTNSDSVHSNVAAACSQRRPAYSKATRGAGVRENPPPRRPTRDRCDNRAESARWAHLNEHEPRRPDRLTSRSDSHWRRPPKAHRRPRWPPSMRPRALSSPSRCRVEYLGRHVGGKDQAGIPVLPPVGLRYQPSTVVAKHAEHGPGWFRASRNSSPESAPVGRVGLVLLIGR